MYRRKRKERDDDHYYTQDFRNTDIENFASDNSMLDRINDRMRWAERRTSEFKDRISKVAQEFISRVPLIKERFAKIQEMIEEHKQIEFTKMFRKYNSSYKRKEKIIRELKEKK